MKESKQEVKKMFPLLNRVENNQVYPVSLKQLQSVISMHTPPLLTHTYTHTTTTTTLLHTPP